ncbi:MAG TPA: hypothetical protein VGJ81_19250 [Thermoanaerobaculia bacterium]|jgi:hypothetical protein
MPDWSIKIVPSSTGDGAAFLPDLQGKKPGDPLETLADDLVTWNNTTEDEHQPWPADDTYTALPNDQVLPRGGPNYLSDIIPAGGSSRPSYDVAQPAGPDPDNPPPTWTVYYICALHPYVESERGTIKGSAY